MKILNFGSLNIDYVYKVEHFVRPGETISSDDLMTFCGGKGLNQSIAIARAGCEVFHAGKIGVNGDMLRECLEKNSVNTMYLESTSRPAGHAIIQVDNKGQNCILLYGGSNEDMDEVFVRRVLSGFGEGDLILLQNEINLIDFIIGEASKKGMIIALNPSPISSDLKNYPLGHVKYFLMNEIEGYELTGEKTAEGIADEMLKRYPDSRIVLTLGKNGVLYIDKDTRAGHGIYKVDVVDTTAAGDTFTGFFIAGLAESLPIEENLERASIASSISVSRMGASDSIPSKREVDQSSLIEN